MVYVDRVVICNHKCIIIECYDVWLPFFEGEIDSYITTKR